MEEIKPSQRIRKLYGEDFSPKSLVESTSKWLVAILTYLDEQAAECSKYSQPICHICAYSECRCKPSKCDHKWVMQFPKNEYGICKHCGERKYFKPSDSGGDKEAEELRQYLERIKKWNCFEAANALIGWGYSKQPKSNDLVALDEESVMYALHPHWPDCTEILQDAYRKEAQLITSKFGQPKARDMSVNDIKFLLSKVNLSDLYTPLDWNVIRERYSKAIHDVLMNNN